MADGSNPNWATGYAPPATEWNLWWGKKYDATSTSMMLNGTGPVTGFGTGIGQVPVFSNRGNLPSFELKSQWIINQATPTGTQGADVFIRHDGTSVTTGTASNINSLLNMTQTVGANDPTANWTLISHVTTNSTKGTNTLAAYMATDRATGSNSHIWGAIVSVTCQTGLNSNAVGNATLAMEVDFASSAADDAPNPAKWGGIGNRHLVHYIATRYSGTAQNEVTVGLWFGTTNSYFDSLIGMDIRGDANNGAKVRQVLDTRGAIPPVGVTDPVAAVRMNNEHIIDFNGGPTLTSTPGNYLQYTITGTKRLRYMVGTTEQWSVSDTGTMVTSALSFPAKVATAPNDLTKHIALWGTTYGFSITSSRLNYVSQVAHWFVVGANDVAKIDATGLSIVQATANTSSLNLGTSTAGNDMTFNGAVGHRRAINWQTAGVGRWRMFIDANDTFQLATLDTAGANLSGVFSITANPGAGSSNSGFSFGNAGTLTLSGAGQTMFNFKHAYTGSITGNLAVWQSNISSDTVDVGNGRAIRGHYFGHSYGGTGATGGRIGVQIDFLQTGPLTTGSNAALILNATMNNPGGTSWTALNSQLVGQNWNTELKQGALYFGVYKAMGECDVSVDSNTAVVTVGTGSPVGTTYSLSFTTTATYQTGTGTPITTPIVITVVGVTGDTTMTVASKLAAAIQMNDQLNQAGIGVSAGQSGATIFTTGLTRAFSLAYADWIGMTVTPSVTGGAGTLTVGAEVKGAGANQVKGLIFVAGGNHGVRGLLSTSIFSVQGSASTGSAGTFSNILKVEGGPGGGGLWPLDPYCTAFQFIPGGVLNTATARVAQSPTRMASFLDARRVNFTQSSGSPFMLPGFRVDGTGAHRIGGGTISRSTTGLVINAPGWEGTPVLAGIGPGTIQGSYAIGDIGSDSYDGQYLITGVDTSGRITTITTLNAPSAPAGAAPAATQTVTGGSGSGWTVTVTWKACTTVALGATSVDTIIGKQVAGAVGDTLGHLLIPFVSGTPTGVPANASKGIALRYDITANKLWAYNGGWKSVTLA